MKRRGTKDMWIRSILVAGTAWAGGISAPRPGAAAPRDKRLGQRFITSACIAFALAAAGSSAVRAEVINLVCKDSDGTTAYFIIDSDKRYVTQQGIHFWQHGHRQSQHPDRQEFVEIDQDFINFGVIRVRDGSKVVEEEINRRTGVWTENGAKPTRCSALPSHRQF